MPNEGVRSCKMPAGTHGPRGPLERGKGTLPDNDVGERWRATGIRRHKIVFDVLTF